MEDAISYGGRSSGKTYARSFASEQQLQAACVLWFNHEYPAHRKALHCNNNNSFNRMEGTKAKAMGVVAGVSDLELVVAGAVIFIEMKLPGKTRSQGQVEFCDYVLSCGHQYIVIETLEQFKQLCRNTVHSGR